MYTPRGLCMRPAHHRDTKPTKQTKLLDKEKKKQSDY